MKSLIVEKYKALGCMVRLRILNLLLTHTEGLFVCEIVNSLKLKQYNISKHLNILRMTDLVVEEKHGKMVLYKANFGKENRGLFHSILYSLEQEKNIFTDDIKNLKEVVNSRVNNKCVITHA